MTTINSDNKICTLINVFTVSPEKHMEVFELLQQATEEVMSKLPGYISANLHISDDRRTITNYAQWSTREDFYNMMDDPKAKVHMKKIIALVKEFRPVTYSKVWTHTVKGEEVFY